MTTDKPTPNLMDPETYLSGPLGPLRWGIVLLFFPPLYIVYLIWLIGLERHTKKPKVEPVKNKGIRPSGYYSIFYRLPSTYTKKTIAFFDGLSWWMPGDPVQRLDTDFEKLEVLLKIEDETPKGLKT